MKIGILTLPFNNNYGGFLQAFALETKLRQYGHDVEIINRQHPKNTKIIPNLIGILKNIAKSIIKFKKYPLNDYNRYRGKLMQKFVAQNMKISIPIYSSEELLTYIMESSFDVIIVGSDQIWRPEYVPNIEDYFLINCPDKIVRIAYAASFGIPDPDFSPAQIVSCGKALRNFSFVGLRENSGKDILRRYGWYGISAQVVPDPTILLPASFYLQQTENYVCLNDYQGKIVTYILDYNDSVSSIIDTLSNILAEPVANILNLNNWKKAFYIMPAIEEWLIAISQSKFVITDSYHGTIFSILFHKPFAVLSNKGRGQDRIDTLLEHFNLRCRNISSIEEAVSICDENIDWEQIDNILDTDRSVFDKLVISKICC